jgi:hypothetical protein
MPAIISLVEGDLDAELAGRFSNIAKNSASLNQTFFTQLKDTPTITIEDTESSQFVIKDIDGMTVVLKCLSE